jgi:hypothetical protein
MPRRYFSVFGYVFNSRQSSAHRTGKSFRRELSASHACADAQTVRQGESVFAIGNPGGATAIQHDQRNRPTQKFMSMASLSATSKAAASYPKAITRFTSKAPIG